MSTTVADERKRLAHRLDELEEERGRILFALAVLDRIDVDESAAAPTEPRVRRSVRRATSVGRPGGTYDRAVRIIASSDQVWQVEDLVTAMKQDGWAANVANEVDAVRSALSRAVSNGAIDRPKIGSYAPKGRREGGTDEGLSPSGSDEHDEDNAVKLANHAEARSSTEDESAARDNEANSNGRHS